MRICLFTPNFLPTVGGAERMADALARGLIGRGHDVRVLCQRQHAGNADVPYPVHCYRRPPAMHRWPGFIGRALRRLRRDWPFELVLAFYAYPTGYAAGRFKRELDIGLVISTRGGDLYPDSHLHRKPGVLHAIRAGYRGADRIVSLSGWMTRRLEQVVGEGLPPIHRIANGIDLEQHDARLAAAADHRPAFIDPGTPFVLHLATLTPKKRHAVAIDAVGQARDAFEAAGAKYLIAGGGQCNDALAAQVRDTKLGDIVKLIGPVEGDDKYWLLGHARFVVSTSSAEGLPNVLLETMASGCPALVSDIEPHTELLAAAPWGRTFATDDRHALAAGLGAMLRDDLWPMRDAAMALRPRYTLDAMVQAYERVCTQALAMRRRTGGDAYNAAEVPLR